MLRFRWIPIVAATALVGALAVACQPADTTAPETGAGEEAAAPTESGAGEAPAEPAAGACEDPLGCVEVAAGAPIKLAYMLVVAGENQKLGLDARRGIELAIDATPELLGHPVELIGEDAGCSAEGGQTAATKLAADTSIVGVIGTSCSSEARPGAPVISDAGLTMISPSATAPDLTEAGKRAPGFFRTAHNDKVQGKVGAEFVFNALGITKVATINDGSPYAVGLVAAFEENYTALGGTITSSEAVDEKATDMRPVLTTIAQGAPELLYYPIFTAAGGFITTQSGEIAGLENVKKMGADGLFSPDFLAAAGEAGVGMFLSSPDFSTFGSAYKDVFLPAHEAAYGEKPVSAFHAHAFDATNMFYSAVETVAQQNPDGSLTIGRQALRDAVAATSGFQGLTGSLSCDANGDCADPHIAVYEISQANIDNGEVPTETEKVFPE